MYWLLFIAAYLIAPTLVTVAVFLTAAFMGFTLALLATITSVCLIAFAVIKMIEFIKKKQNPIHKTNRKYLKGRLNYLPI
jgi:membrane protein implicated in regulation of membrane protease activity